MYTYTGAQAKAEKIIKKYSNYELHECLTHGNLTLENLLWDYEKEKILMIDPYGETYCETILGDVSQVFQSSLSGYEVISYYLKDREVNIFVYPYDKIPECIRVFSRNLEKQLELAFWYERDVISIFRASQFTRMFPFKLSQNQRLAFFFLNHATELIDNIKC